MLTPEQLSVVVWCLEQRMTDDQIAARLEMNRNTYRSKLRASGWEIDTLRSLKPIGRVEPSRPQGAAA